MDNTYNEQGITHIMQSETFRITALSLAKQLHIPLPEAEQALIIEIAEHRHVLDNATETLTAKQRAQINYAKKDITRHQHKASTAYMSLFVPKEDTSGNDKLENVAGRVAEETSYSEDEISRALTVLPMTFQKPTAEYINEVLTKGAEQFKKEHEWTNGYFNKQLKQWIKTSKSGNARKRLDTLLKSDYQIKREENIQSAKSFLQMIEQDSNNSWIINWLNQALDNPYFDEAFDVTKYPGKIVKHWDTPETRKDCYKFINKLNEMIEREEKK
ncbi:hypothetical protein [Weissella hellenica]|uniref:hypothetical protein n=1 Tax=Weissella hellenica TaxID=46256 RepID=UPI00388A5937